MPPNHASTKQFTVFEYLYRDAGNYKAFGAVLLEGACTEQDAAAIISACESGMYFVAEQVGVVPLYEQLYENSGGPTEDDHVFHEFAALRSATPEEGEIAEMALDVLIRRFQNAARCWDYTLSAHWEPGVWR